MSTRELFSRQVLSLPLSRAPSGNGYSLRTPENAALDLAQHSRFDEMCKDILWGSESRHELGEMLRSLVITFLPETEYHLRLLKNVANSQWTLERLIRIQANVFGGDAERGEHGLPKGTHNALDYALDVSAALKDLQRSISVYQSVRGSPGRRRA